MANAYKDENDVSTLIASSNVDGKTPVRVYADPITHRLLVDLAIGSGTVTEVDTGTGLTGGPITTSGTISLDSKLAPLDTLGTAGQLIRVNAGATALEYFTSSGGGVSTVVGTSNRISVNSTDPANPIVDISAAYVGQTSITTLGTIATGTWAGTTIAVAHGGTGGTSAGITLFNNITGYTASGATGTTSTNIVFSTSPTLVTPTLGVATATSINGNTFTTGTYTLTGTAGKTLNFTNTLTFSGTDSTTMTFPTTSASIARTDAAQTFTGTQTLSQIVTTSNAITATSNAATVPITSRISTVTNSSAATLTITITTASAVDGMMLMVRVLDFSGVAQTITWVNTENSTVSVPVTSNGSTTLPLTVGFQFNSNTTKWRCVGLA